MSVYQNPSVSPGAFSGHPNAGSVFPKGTNGTPAWTRGWTVQTAYSGAASGGSNQNLVAVPGV